VRKFSQQFRSACSLQPHAAPCTFLTRGGT
jgi:hypothetical protein